jgi:hypothetical protein
MSEDDDTRSHSSREEAPDIESLASLISEWLILEEEIKTISASVKEKRTRAKTVQAMITKIMKDSNTGTINIRSGTVMVQPPKGKKESMSKKYLLSALTEYFKGDAAGAAACVAYLEAKRPIRSGVEKLILEPRAGGSVVSGAI